MRYYILDDDIATRKILIRIINEQLLGHIVGEEADPIEAESEIINLQPDIVLIDLLMPQQDGIETVQHLRQKSYKGKFIMISQIENKEMVAEAYEQGVEYFIHKPINRVEVTSVIQKVIEQMKMEESLNKIKEGLSLFQKPDQNDTQSIINNRSQTLQDILSDLGVIGENGSHDIIELILYMNEHQTLLSDNRSLKELYRGTLLRKTDHVTQKDLKSLEQRIRRTISQAMTNIASLGLTDYAHPKFEYYASKFFDFNEIRLKMNELDQRAVNRSPRINVRKFIYALYNEMLNRID